MQNFLDFHTNIFSANILKCVHLFAKNMNGCSHKKNSSFCCQERKYKKIWGQLFFQRSSLYKYFSIFFSAGSSKILAPVHLEICSTGPLIFPYPSASLLEFQLWKSPPLEWGGFQLVPKYQSKVELISHIPLWNARIAKKMVAKMRFS